jgi:hypothetical protein
MLAASWTQSLPPAHLMAGVLRNGIIETELVLPSLPPLHQLSISAFALAGARMVWACCLLPHTISVGSAPAFSQISRHLPSAFSSFVVCFLMDHENHAFNRFLSYSDPSISWCTPSEPGFQPCSLIVRPCISTEHLLLTYCMSGSFVYRCQDYWGHWYRIGRDMGRNSIND